MWLYIISTNTKMFKNPKWITFDILGLCNQLLATQQRAIQLFNDLQRNDSLRNTILIDRIRSLAIISLCTIQDPWEIIFSSKIVYTQMIVRTWFSNMIVEKDALNRLCQMVQIGPKVVRRWTEGGRDYGYFGDDTKMWVVLLVSWLVG